MHMLDLLTLYTTQRKHYGVCGVRQNLYVSSLCRNHDLDDRVFDCLLTSIAAVHAEDVYAYFLFVDDLNGHYLGWFVLQPIIGMVLKSLTSQLCLVAISWLPDRPTHVVEHLTS